MVLVRASWWPNPAVGTLYLPRRIQTPIIHSTTERHRSIVSHIYWTNWQHFISSLRNIYIYSTRPFKSIVNFLLRSSPQIRVYHTEALTAAVKFSNSIHGRINLSTPSLYSLLESVLAKFANDERQSYRNPQWNRLRLVILYKSSLVYSIQCKPAYVQSTCWGVNAL